MPTIREVLEKLCGDRRIRTYWENEAIIQAETEVRKAMLEELPKPKQVRYEQTKRQMGLDGKIIETEKLITYSKEDETFNDCLAQIKAKIGGEK
jgi:hypothetical protein